MDSATQTSNEPKSKNPSKELKDHAATAALYVTNPPGNTRGSTKKKKSQLLDADGKLSSASAALSLKHAQPRELPSFPVVGVANSESSAGAAASLAAANQTTFEHWKPDALPHAAKAAYLAKDYKAEPLWEPELGTAGSKAALLAHRKGANVELWQASATSEGSSAAGQAMRKKGLAPKAYAGIDKEAADGALTAATGAFASQRYNKPFPPVPPTQSLHEPNYSSGALNAATKAHKPWPEKQASVPSDLRGMSAADAKRIHDAAVTNLTREMYTSAPPVAPEVEERNRLAGLNAAAVSMAKQMYEAQQLSSAAAGAAARSASSRKSESESASEDLRSAAQSYIHLQEAARKLASERLAKLHDENAAYKNYYGQQQSPPRRGFSLRSRRRSSSDGEASDPRRAQQIRSQMVGLSRGVEEVDEKKRKTDREALLEAARRNVRQSMHGMDERVFAETGKASLAMQADWEERARAQAKERSTKRLENHGKVDIGGGKYLDQSEIDAIAAARVQPELDRITAKAERDRARDEANRKAEEQRRLAMEEKERQEKDRKRMTDAEWRKFKEDEKAEKQRQKDEEKARKAEEKKLRKEKEEEAKWAAVRDKERTKEERAEAKREQEANRKAEKDREAKLAAELDAINEEEKRKAREEKAAEKKEEREAAVVEEEVHKQEKEHEREIQAAAEEEAERDEVAKEVHEIALKVRQDARAAAVLQYLQQEQDKVKAEEEQKRENEKDRAKDQKEWQDRARNEELAKIDREIAEAKEKEKKEHEAEKEGKKENKDWQEAARDEELANVDREIEAKKEDDKNRQKLQEESNEEQKDAGEKMRAAELTTVGAEQKAVKEEVSKKSKLQKGRASTDKNDDTSKGADVSKVGSSSTREDKGKAKGKGKSRGLGLGAMAAAIGIGEREKKQEQKSPLAQQHDSDASTSLESLSSDEDTRQPIAKQSAEVKGNPAEVKGNPAEVEGNPAEAKGNPATDESHGKHDEPVQKRVAPPVRTHSQTAEPASTITTTVEGGEVKPKEGQPKKEQGKRSSWFKLLGRRSSKPENKSEKLTKSPASKASETKDKPKGRVIEPITGLVVDPTKANPGFGTDNIPHIGASPPNPASGAPYADAGESSKHATGSRLQPSITGASASTAATAPSQAASTSGKPTISAPIHTRSIQNSAGFAVTPAPVTAGSGGGPAVTIPGPSAALEPGVPPPPSQTTDSAYEAGAASEDVPETGATLEGASEAGAASEDAPDARGALMRHPTSEGPPSLCPPVPLQQGNDSARDIALAGREPVAVGHEAHSHQAGSTARDADQASTDLDSSDEERAEALRNEPAVLFGETEARGRLSGAPGLPEEVGGSALMGGGGGGAAAAAAAAAAARDKVQEGSSRGGNGAAGEKSPAAAGSWLKTGGDDDAAADDEWQEANDRFDADDLPLPVMRPMTEVTGSPSRGLGGTRFKEDL